MREVQQACGKSHMLDFILGIFRKVTVVLFE